MRLIDADALKEEFGDTNMDIYTDEVKEYIDEAPTIEPKAKVIAQVTFDEEKMREIVKEAVERFKEEYEIEPKRGEWIEDYNNTYGRCRMKCSVCGKFSGIGGIKSNQRKPFCPNCGADMRKESE